MNVCDQCQTPFKPKNGKQKRCSRACTRVYEKAHYQELYPVLPYKDTSTSGSISELAVCADLLKKGFNVYRNVCPTGTPDVVAIDGTEVVRVEVKTGRMNPGGSLSFPTIKPDNYALFDVLAIATSASIFYRLSHDAKPIAAETLVKLLTEPGE